MRAEVSYLRLFEPKQHSPEVDVVLEHCITQESALRLSLRATGVTLSTDTPGQRSRALLLTGRWRSPLLEAAYRNAGALLLAPFMFLIEDLSLPHDSLYTLGRGGRSLADLFMRNLFFAACRSEQMLFHTSPDSRDATVVQGSRGLARTYCLIAKAYLKDNVFNRSNAQELILACAHLPILEFSHPLMEVGIRDYRRVSAEAGPDVALFEQKRAFLEARNRWLAIYRT